MADTTAQRTALQDAHTAILARIADHEAQEAEYQAHMTNLRLGVYDPAPFWTTEEHGLHQIEGQNARMALIENDRALAALG